MTDQILVIKLGALGDFLQAAGPFSAIRHHHPGAHITLLTTTPYFELAEAAPWFDAVWLDHRPTAMAIGTWMALRNRLRNSGFARVYDLQTSDRTSFYHRLFWPGKPPEWAGIASGCSHPHSNSQRDFMHTVDRQREQLVMAGLTAFPEPDWSWIKSDIARFDIGERFALLVPGGASHRPAKRWPIERFAALAQHLAGRGIRPVILGTEAERNLADEIILAEPDARDLCGVTSLADLLALVEGAIVSIGNDTGPMHAAAMRGCPSIVLFSAESDPDLCAPRGASVQIAQRPDLQELAVDAVIDLMPTTLTA